MGSAKMC